MAGTPAKERSVPWPDAATVGGCSDSPYVTAYRVWIHQKTVVACVALTKSHKSSSAMKSLGVRDVGLLQHAVALLADKVFRDVLLKGDLTGFLALGQGHPLA